MDQANTIDDSLIAKFLAGEATPEEAILVTDWIDQSNENKTLFSQAQQAWALQENISPEVIDKSQAWRSVSKRISTMRRSRTLGFTPLRIAAAVLVLVSVAAAVYLLIPSTPMKEEWITTNSKEEIFNLPLPEGTSIVLNKNSTLSYPKEFKNATRLVKLTGQAFFDVMHKPDQPFIIECGDVSIKVLGTAFNVSGLNNASIVETQVTRGKVMMYDKDNSIIIEAGWTGSYERSSKKLSLKKTKTENNLGYATHTFTFEDTSLKQVTENLSESYGVTFVFENEKLKDCHLTSSYNNKPLSFILNVIAESLNLEYTVKGNTVYLSGNGCL